MCKQQHAAVFNSDIGKAVYLLMPHFILLPWETHTCTSQGQTGPVLGATLADLVQTLSFCLQSPPALERSHPSSPSEILLYS